MSDIEAAKATHSVGANYDALPYLSKAFFHVCPEHMRANAKFFGMNPAELRNARVLDLGCGTGNNLLNFASNYPKSEVIGIDLSSKEIEEGQKWVKDLGIKNLDLRCASIMDIDKSYGEFDYIICHGVFSWVPEEVQNKILEIANKNLKKDGVAFISYNCLPGWNSINAIRNMLQFHSRYFKTIPEKVEQSKAFLKFIGESLEGSKSPYVGFLERECAIIANSDDSFLFHEYIEEGNTEFYFSDFIAKARSYGLDYMSDATLAAMSAGNLPPKAAEKIASITDIIRQEQYMDFVTDRRFRNTLLCKQGVKLNRNITPDTIRDLYFNINVESALPLDKVDFNAKTFTASFKIGNEKLDCTASSPVSAAGFYALESYKGKGISLSEIKEFISSNCNGVKFGEKEEIILLNEFVSLIIKGVMHIKADRPNTISVITDKPKASDLAIYQAKNNHPYITSGNNESVPFDNMSKIILAHLDGSNNFEDLTKILDKFLKDNGQFIQVEGKRVTDDKLKFRILGEMVSKSLQFAALYGFLVG